MIDRLKWMLEQLLKLEDNERVRSEGIADFRTVKNELVDVIATYTAPVAPLPAILQTVLQPGELDSIVRSAVALAVSEAGGKMLETVSAVFAAEHEEFAAEIQASDVAVMAAITETRAELLAAVAPAGV